MLLGSNYRNDAVEKLYGDRIGDSSIIFTPWDTVENMLDLIPEDFWTPDVTILDMYCKSGRFLVGAFRKLYNSPYLAYLSESERTLHILNKQLFGLCADMTCMLLSEANLYGHAQYGKKHIKLVDTYDYNSVVKQRKDGIINRTLEGKFGQMKFDLVIGNPPYNKDAYIDFVEIGHKLATQYDCWVTPAKWNVKGGQKNEQFRKEIVPYMRKIVYYPNCSDIFLIGEQSGITYYVSGKDICNTKELENRSIAQTLYNNKLHREIGLTLNNVIYSIHEHIQKMQGYKAFKWGATVTNRKYCLAINNKVNNERGIAGQYQAYGTISYTTGKSNVICAPFIVEDIIESIDLTNADKVILSSDNRHACASMQSWLNTKFVRFFVYGRLCGISPVISDITFAMVPAPEAFDHIFTDEELYKKYNLTPEEINIIESVIKERK